MPALDIDYPLEPFDPTNPTAGPFFTELGVARLNDGTGFVVVTRVTRAWKSHGPAFEVEADALAAQMGGMS
jgi:hypothetical protein